MQKHWYAVYTRENCEKKVAAALSKKKIENFLPLNSIVINFQKRNRIIHEPLFPSYIFVNLSAKEISLIKNIDGIINFIYWKGAPAIINTSEIEAVKGFTSTFSNISIERSKVNHDEKIKIDEMPALSVNEEANAEKNKTVQVTLPSLGYIISAKKEESIFTSETNILQNNSFVHIQ